MLKLTKGLRIVIDAMDECQEPDEVAKFIQILLESGNFYVMVSSRNPIPKCLEQLRVALKLSLDDEERMVDIIKHIDKAIWKDSGRFKGVENEIKDRLIDGAHGQ